MLEEGFALLSIKLDYLSKELTVKTYQERALPWQEQNYAKPLQVTKGLVIQLNY